MIKFIKMLAVSLKRRRTFTEEELDELQEFLDSLTEEKHNESEGGQSGKRG